jgi:hypothetical protein
MLSLSCLRRAFLVIWQAGFLCACALSLSPAVGRTEELLDLCRQDSLPADIRGSLERRFKDWKIQEPTNLSPHAREIWAAERPLACPGIAAGHFENSRVASYALLLVTANRFRLLIFTQQVGQQLYGFRLVDEADGSSGDVFLKTVPTFRYLGDQSKRSRPGDSVLLVNAGPNATPDLVYIWAADGYERQAVTRESSSASVSR